jgi:hypothetical protein
LEIAQLYAEKDKRIRIHNNIDFVGCDANGNIALKQISPQSKYCKVVHADDWIFPDCIMKMVELAEANPTVTIVCAYGLRNERVAWDGLPYGNGVIPGREVCRATLLGGPYVFGSPTSMLIRSDEVRKRPAFYNEANPHCDIEICLDILQNHDFGFVHQVLTFTRDHSHSETASGSRFGTEYLGFIEHLGKYGRVYLNDYEYQKTLNRAWQDYYKFLGAKVFQRKDKGFWKFHTDALSRLGYSLSRLKVAQVVLAEIVGLTLNPLKTSGKILKKLSRLFHHEHQKV